MDTDHPTHSPEAESFARLVSKNVKELSAEEIAEVLNFLTPENLKHWQCVLDALGYVVNVKGNETCPATSFTFRLVDSREHPALAIHQYTGLNAKAGQSRGHLFLEPKEKNKEIFAAFGRFLETAESVRR